MHVPSENLFPPDALLKRGRMPCSGDPGENSNLLPLPAPGDQPPKPRSYAPLHQFLARANTLLLVEARDEAAAGACYKAIVERSPGAPEVSKISPRLFFAQDQPSGRYWRFRRGPG